MEGVEAEVKFEDIQNILAELQEALNMATKRATLLGKRLRSEVEEDDLKYVLAEIGQLEKGYIFEAQTKVSEMPCWFEYVATKSKDQ